MNRPPFLRPAAALIAAALAFPAFATGPQAPAAADASAADASDAAAGTGPAARATVDRHCLRHTGSRIVARRDGTRDCVTASGRVYGREDLERTGGVDIADALRKLDPSVR